MTLRVRVAMLLALTVVLVVSVGGYVVVRAVSAHRERTETRARGPVADSLAGVPHVVFRTTGRGSDNGLVGAVRLDDRAGARSNLGLTCDRVYAVTGRTVCLRTERGVATSFDGRLLDADGRQTQRWSLPGIPSRTRLSPDGRLEADTSFVTGHSYMQVGFSTATVIRRVGGADYGNLERFVLRVDGRRLTASDRNIWGVTFAKDDRTFYATAASRGRTWLVRGDLSTRTLTSVRGNAECPSLSPDGTKVAYKKRVPRSSGHWSLAVLDLSSGRETVLGERRSVDDQVEWLDDSTLLYAVPRSGQVGVTDVYALGISAQDRPRLFLARASSPAVVR